MRHKKWIEHSNPIIRFDVREFSNGRVTKWLLYAVTKDGNKQQITRWLDPERAEWIQQDYWDNYWPGEDNA